MKSSIKTVVLTAVFALSLSLHAKDLQDGSAARHDATPAANDAWENMAWLGESQPTTDADALQAQDLPRDAAAGTSIGNGPPTLDIRHPSFAGGARCDGSTDIGPALQAAWNALPSAGGEIQIIGSPKACYWANPTTFAWGRHTGPITIFLQGELRTGTTLTFPAGVQVNLIGKSGVPGTTAQFQAPGQSAWILVKPISNVPATGTLGTAVTSIAVPTTFTPSSMNGLYSNTAITVAGTLTCNITSIVRAHNMVTATLSSACHIPAGVAVKVAGVTGSSFNGTYRNSDPIPHPFLAVASDYVLNTLTWNQTGANESSKGGTVTGFNEDTVESVQLTSCTARTCTATFARTHDASDQWGVVGVNVFNHSGGAKLIRDISITADGTALWLQQDYQTRLENVGASAVGACTGNLANWPIELGDASFILMDGIAANVGCLPWSIRLTQPSNQGYTGSGPIYLNNSFIMSGIKLDHGAGGVYVKNTVVEQATRGAVVVDPTNYWSGNQLQISLENSGVQDNPNGINSCFIYYETPVYSGLASANVALKHMGSSSCLTNDYFYGAISTEFPNAPASYGLNRARGVLGVYNDGKAIEAEVRGEQAGLSPAVIPYPTLPVTTNPADWSGSCTVTKGVLAPDGTNTAGALTAGSGTGFVLVEKYSVTPKVGDMVLYGGWVYTPTQGNPARGGAGGSAFALDNAESHFQFNTGRQNNTNQYDSGILDDWWHPVVGFASITSAEGTTGTMRMALACDQAKKMEYWQPFMIYIPASANIPLQEVMRWRQQLMHGYVPPGAKAGTMYSGYPIVLPGDPTADNQAATKHYVDSHLSRSSSTVAGATPAEPLTDLPPACQQLPCVIAKGSQAGLKSATDLNLITRGTAGTYRVTLYGYVTTAGNTGAGMSLCISWSDGYTPAGNTCPVNNQPATTLTRYNYTQTLHLAAGQTIHTYNSCSNGAMCNIDWAVERLQ